jgi:hypothetical protein
MADPGAVSKGTHSGPGGWDPITWNSCRCDTAEFKIFPVGGAVPTGTGLVLGRWMADIHESDPKFATLGVNKFRCRRGHHEVGHQLTHRAERGVRRCRRG